MKTYSLQEIAEFLGAQVSGDPTVKISGINGILEAGEGDLTFLANPKYKNQLPACRASAVVVDEEVSVEGMNLIQIRNPRLAFARAVKMMVPAKVEKAGVSDRAFISESAQLGDNVTVYPGVFVGENSVIGDNTVLFAGAFIGDDVTIGNDCLIYSNVSVHHDTKIGSRVILNSNCVVGSEGFGYERDGERHFKIPQIGNVVIEDDVEVGALCAIDRGSIKSTVIGECTKLDNLVHVAHNCELGENNLLLSQAGIAGTVKTGKNVYFAGKAGCLDHIKIADRIAIGTCGIVTNNIEKEGVYYGYPTRPQKEWQKASAMFYHTDEQRRKVSDLERKVKELEGLVQQLTADK